MAVQNRLGIIGATGYVGMELVRLLVGHGQFKLTCLSSQSYAGQAYSDVYPAFRGLPAGDQVLTAPDPDAIAAACDIVVTALPHGVSAAFVPGLLDRGLKILDHSGDFRYRRQSDYETAYKLNHPCPQLLSEAVYGLPEIYREQIAGARLVANPGCYPTCSLLALMPALKNNLIHPTGIVIDAWSGISGAGRKSDLAFSFCEAQNSMKPYGVTEHRHTSEIEQEGGFLAGQPEPLTITFTPHLAPVKRGMLATVYADLASEIRVADVQAIYESYYENQPFVRVLPAGQLPETRNSTYTNFADLAVTVDSRTGKLKILSAIDNLGKGASGQALQSLNLMAGLPEVTGLQLAGGAL